VRLHLPSDVTVGKHKVAGVGNITVTASAKAFEGFVALAVVPLPAIALEELELGDGLIAAMQSL
jgi:hypothetical protein